MTNNIYLNSISYNINHMQFHVFLLGKKKPQAEAWGFKT